MRPALSHALRVNTLKRLRINYRRAVTVYEREQVRGQTDMSAQQTRRMALSVYSLERAAGALRREELSQKLCGGKW